MACARHTRIAVESERERRGSRPAWRIDVLDSMMANAVGGLAAERPLMMRAQSWNHARSDDDHDGYWMSMCDGREREMKEREREREERHREKER